MNATAQSKPSIEREIASIISNPDRFIEVSSVMISVSCAILDDFMKMISIASGMKSVGEAVFSIPQMIIDVTAIAAIDNYFRDGNDFVRDGNNSLKDGKNHFHTGAVLPNYRF